MPSCTPTLSWKPISCVAHASHGFRRARFFMCWESLVLDLVLIVAGIGVIAVHSVLSRSRLVWAGAIVPTFWLLIVGYLAIHGALSQPRDYVMAVGGLAALLWAWTSGRRKAAAIDVVGQS